MSFFPAGQGFLAGLAGTVNGNLTVTGRVLLAAGSQALPSLTFAGDSDTGIYNNTTDEIRLVGGGAVVGTGSINRGFEGDLELRAPARTILSAALLLSPESVKVANYPATATDSVIVMNNAGLTLTLPLTPADGRLLFVRNNNVGTLAIARNGESINGTAADITLLATSGAVFSYITGSGWWVVG